MTLEVRRELIPIGTTSGQWEQRPYSQVVWAHDGTAAQVFPITVPHDFALGLLTVYLDRRQTDLPIFDAALKTVGYSRLKIEQALAAVPPLGPHEEDAREEKHAMKPMDDYTHDRVRGPISLAGIPATGGIPGTVTSRMYAVALPLVGAANSTGRRGRGDVDATVRSPHADRLMPEPDFESIARNIVRDFDGAAGEDSVELNRSKAEDIAEQLRLVWNARGAADLAMVDAEWREDLDAAAIGRAIQKVDR